MATTASVARDGLLKALEADIHDATVWNALADWLEEEKPGEFVECPGMQHAEGNYCKGIVGMCGTCKSKGRLWVPNQDIERMRGMAGLLVGDGKKKPKPMDGEESSRHTWTREENKAHLGPWTLPYFLWKIIGDMHSDTDKIRWFNNVWWTYHPNEKAAFRALHAAMRQWAATATGTPSPS